MKKVKRPFKEENGTRLSAEQLQLLNIRYPENSHIERAELSIILCYQQKKEYTKALIAVHKFVRDYPQSKWLESALQLRSDLENQAASNNSNKDWATAGKVLVGIWVGIKIIGIVSVI